jgi:hypothetical protein
MPYRGMIMNCGHLVMQNAGFSRGIPMHAQVNGKLARYLIFSSICETRVAGKSIHFAQTLQFKRVCRSETLWHVLSYQEITMMIAAIGYAILYLLLGGGFGGAVLIFIIAKLFRR